MQIEIDVTGGTDRMTRCHLYINGQKTGELQIQRTDFTKLCDLIFKGQYSITKDAGRSEE